MSLNVGAKQLADACATVETSATEGNDIKNIAMEIKLVIATFKAAHKELPSYIEKYQNIAA